MPEPGLKELLEAGVHFGHQTRRWNPNMRRYIFGELDGIHIVDLVQTETLLQSPALRGRAGERWRHGALRRHEEAGPWRRSEWAGRCQMPYVNQRWLGGLLTNFNTISARIQRLHELTSWKEEGRLRAAAHQGADGHAGRAPQSSSTTSAGCAKWSACPTRSSSPT